MDLVYEELDEVKAEFKKLTEEYRVKAELAESLKRSQSEIFIKSQEANQKLEKLARELNGKKDEICAANQINEELKSNLKDKEAAIKHLTSANSKLRLDYGEKLRKCEEENKELGLALDEANAKNMDQEKQICSLKEEIEGGKRLLTVLQKKSSEAENKAKASKEVQLRDDVFHELEEKNRSFEDRLKWKNEQFGHLEEAHEKLRRHLQVREKEWEKEKAVLIDDISSLQSNLESQIRISEDLQNRFNMCNQALAHEEGKRKLLEVQLLEFKNRFGFVCDEYEEAKLKIESLTSQRDQEIATLRGSLGTKETLYKEMQYQFNKLELEKKELMVLIKELQEAQIQEAGNVSSSSKFRNKLKSLEAHRDCSMSLKAKEAEWRLLNEKLKVDLNICRSALESKDISINELKKELEACRSLTLELELQNEENSLLLLVLKSEISEAQLVLANYGACMDQENKELEKTISILVEQLEMKKENLIRVQKGLEEEHEKTVILSRKLKSIEEERLPLHEELDRLKEMLKESSTRQLHSEEQVLQIQSDLKTIHDALDRANEELYEKFCELNEVEFELQIWKSIAEQFKINVRENHQMRRDVEASLIAQVDVEVNLKREKESLCHQLEEKNKRIDDLQQQIAGLNERIKSEETASLEGSRTAGKEISAKHSDETAAEGLQKELNCLVQELINKELEAAIIARVEKNYEQEKETLSQIVEEKDQRIYDLQQLVASLEQEFESSTCSFSSQLAKMQTERNSFHDSWEKIKTAEVLKHVEIQEKSLIITELEHDLSNLQEIVEQQDRTLFSSRKKREEIEAELESKQLEIYKLECEFEEKQLSSDTTIEKLTNEKAKIIEHFSDRENLFSNTMGLLSDRIQKLSVEDMQLMEKLGRIVHAMENDGPRIEMNGNYDDEYDPVKENMNTYSSSPLMKRAEAIHDERSPLRALNN
ncbi:unnamed protein product [Fraxinus pennsylvanica]|uniref:Uncharacterized protein n=1 Tax=Fraxinus pennsylvanica TaxID=56036 RepID=A0AAD2DID9_9LAMI|nr:unnamed protein product [Fraxinus pennsylvanica]